MLHLVRGQGSSVAATSVQERLQGEEIKGRLQGEGIASALLCNKLEGEEEFSVILVLCRSRSVKLLCAL